MPGSKICWGVTAASLAAVVAMGYLFLVRGSVTGSADGRTAILLAGSERDLVLAEMRGFLESVQAIVAAASRNDMATVAASARKVGSAAANEVPVTVMGKLPLEFKTLGLATHSAFDEIALEAEGIGSGEAVLAGLGTLLLNCTSCHAGYRLALEAPGAK